MADRLEEVDVKVTLVGVTLFLKLGFDRFNDTRLKF